MGCGWVRVEVLDRVRARVRVRIKVWARVMQEQLARLSLRAKGSSLGVRVLARARDG
jgi:hypothetical protein